MRVLLDSSSVINLVNAGALELVCSLEDTEWWLPPAVVDESGPSCAAVTLELQQKGQINFLDDGEMDAERFLYLLDTYSLGAGETECVAVAVDADYHVCCDDRRARTMAAEIIGADRVFGTVGLLKRCVQEQRIDCSEARRMLCLMRESGGFLPDTPQSYFCTS